MSDRSIFGHSTEAAAIGQAAASVGGDQAVGHAISVGDAILAAVAHASLDCLIITDAEGRVIEFNPAAVATFGWPRKVALGRPIGELIVPPAFRAAHEAGIARYLAGAAAKVMGRRVEMTAMRADGETFPVELTVTEAWAEGRRLFAASLRDLSGAQARERALRESESFLQTLLNDQDELVFRYDRDLRIIFCNAATCRSFGIAREELLGRPMRDYVLAEVWPRLASELRTLTPERPLVTGTDPKLMPSGETRWFEWTNRALFDESSRLTGYQAVGRDVTERRRADRALAESEARLAAFMRHAPIGMYVKDEAGRYLMANPEMRHVFGRPTEEVIGRTADELLDGEAAAVVAAADAEVRANRRPAQIEEHLPGLERYAWTLVVRFPIEGPPGQGLHVGGFDIDITDMKRTESELAASREALHQSEKLRSMGSLLAGVAHELNNPLAIVLIQAVMLEEDAQEDPLRQRAAKIRHAAERCARIVQTFMALARRKPLERRRVVLADVARAALEIASYALRTSDIEVALEVEPDLPPLAGDPDQLHQLVLNLLVNAQQALASRPPPRRIEVRVRRPSADLLALEVADNGPGVPPEHRERIFEEFFTTKPQGAGMGFGLAFSRSVAEAHRGRLVLLPEGAGATFRMTLPIAAGRAEATAAVEPATGAPARCCALVVDDEPEIAGALAELLAADGYAVEAALSGEAARSMLAETGFDLILCDLRMPGIDGRQLFTWLQQARPELVARLAFATGDALGSEAARFLAEAGRPVLEKPFTQTALRRVVSAIRRA